MLLGWVAGEVIATDPAVEPLLHRLLDGTMSFDIEAVSGLFAGKSHLSSTVDLMEIVAALSGALIVLIAGAIWRSRALRHRHKEAKVVAVPARGIDLP
jgi:hypothetical protein